MKYLPQIKLLRNVEELVKGKSHYQMLINSPKKNPDLVKFNFDQNTFSRVLNEYILLLNTCSVERSFSIDQFSMKVALIQKQLIYVT